jgi:hypothetical protein
MIVWGGNDGNALNSGGRYNPATDAWAGVAANSGLSGRSNHTAIWTGTEMVIWGGRSSGSLFGYSDGACYVPAGDYWSTLTSPVGAPQHRWDHTAVWTGTEMIVWGGQYAMQFYNGQNYYYVFYPYGDGARLNLPINNSWTGMTGAGAPSARAGAVGIWTGSRMIIWGGGGASTGARYDPAGNSWTVMTNTNAPKARYGSSSVWTGSEMIIWGGGINSTYYNDGGRYDPVLDTWASMTPLGAPSARRGHSAIWTGAKMLIFGGYNADPELSDTYSYTPPRTMYLYVKP